MFIYAYLHFLLSRWEFDITTPDTWLNLILQFQHVQTLRVAGLLGLNASHLETLTQTQDD